MTIGQKNRRKDRVLKLRRRNAVRKQAKLMHSWANKKKGVIHA